MKTKYLIIICTLVCCQAVAQTDSLLIRDYQTVKSGDAWLTSTNAAALTRFSSQNIAEAEASLTIGNGGLVDYNGSDKIVSANIGIESFYRLGRRVVVYGDISYVNWTGWHMTGSAFLPLNARHPFDIVEATTENEGRKHSDIYHLKGGCGVDVYNGISLGAYVDYTAGNYAKYKDLRHKNKLMDLSASVSAYAPVTDWLSLGAAYIYHRQSESVDFGTYGKSEKVYKSLIDYGAFMGREEQFGNEGFTDKAREMPLFEDGHGGIFQLEVTPFSIYQMPVTLYGSIGFSHGSGYYGRRSPYTVTLTDHDRDILDIQGRISMSGSKSRFYLDLSYAKEKVHNNAETYRELTNDNGATYYEYFDAVETGDKQWKDFALSANALLGMHGEMPTWRLGIAYKWHERNISSYLYPFYRHQLLSNNTVEISATRNIICRKGVWSVSINGSYQKGSGEPFLDGAFVTPSNLQELPSVMETFLNQEYRYFTAPQYTIGAGVKYAFVFPNTRLKTHARIGFSHRTTNEHNDYTIGNRHTQFTVAVGCTF